MIYNSGSVPEIILTVPPPLGDHLELCPFVGFDSTSIEKSRKLTWRYQALAAQLDCLAFDSGIVACTSHIDQVHIEVPGHDAIAKGLAAILSDLSKKA